MIPYEEFIKKYDSGSYHKYANGSQQIKQEGGEAYKIAGIEDEEELKVVAEGAEFARRTFITNKTLFATNQVKSVFIESIKTILEPQYILGTFISISSKKTRQRLVDRFNRISFRILSPEIFKDIHRTSFGRELQYAIFEFTRHLVSEESADRFAEIVSTIIENDDAYRYRIMDILSMTTNEKLRNPKELSRLFDIFFERNNGVYWSEKIKKMVKLIRYLAIFYKKSYISAVESINLDNFKLVDEDIYWCTFKSDYNFMGMKWEDRKKYAEAKGWKFPNKVV
jgi:hypothetical protein